MPPFRITIVPPSPCGRHTASSSAHGIIDPSCQLDDGYGSLHSLVVEARTRARDEGLPALTGNADELDLAEITRRMVCNALHGGVAVLATYLREEMDPWRYAAARRALKAERERVATLRHAREFAGAHVYALTAHLAAERAWDEAEGAQQRVTAGEVAALLEDADQDVRLAGIRLSTCLRRAG